MQLNFGKIGKVAKKDRGQVYFVSIVVLSEEGGKGRVVYYLPTAERILCLISGVS
jgi:hypothetical protein